DQTNILPVGPHQPQRRAEPRRQRWPAAPASATLLHRPPQPPPSSPARPPLRHDLPRFPPTTSTATAHPLPWIGSGDLKAPGRPPSHAPAGGGPRLTRPRRPRRHRPSPATTPPGPAPKTEPRRFGITSAPGRRSLSRTPCTKGLLLNSQKNHAFASPSCGTTRPDPIISENMYYVYGSLHVLVEQDMQGSQL
uniref:Uncharacterized protein n=2 Tax=Aegilops tauschii subsp. strangulata TaxID=200361 RepID=A0A453HFA5_AEGTS